MPSWNVVENENEHVIIESVRELLGGAFLRLVHGIVD